MPNINKISLQGTDSINESGKITWEISMKGFQEGVVSGVYPGDAIKDIKDAFHEVRTSKQGTEQYSKNKKALPGVIPQARFKPDPDKKYMKGHRKDAFFDSFTGVVVIDIDNKIQNQKFKIRTQVEEKLKNYCYVIAYSPGGNGVHAYLRADIKDKTNIAQVLKGVSKVLGMKIDTMTKDPTRVMCLTYDPDAFINKSPEIYKVPAAITGTLLEPADEFFDIETLMTKKKLLGKVRYTGNVIWNACLILAKNFEREYVESYLSDEGRRKVLFHSESSTVNDLVKIKSNLKKAYEDAKKWMGGFDDCLKMDDGIYRVFWNEESKKIIKPVNKNMFCSNYGEYAIKQLREYRYFATIPNNYPGVEGVEFTPVPEECYNLYEPLKHHPVSGSWEHIKIMFEHFSRDQTEHLYDYVKLLLTKPSQILPILVLISTDRETGKTTLLNFFSELLNPNGIVISMQDFSSRFNSHYATKSLVAIDESKLDKRELEKIKSFSTAKYIACEHKGRDVFYLRNMQHYILTSNSLDFTYYDKQETRFWCFQFPSIEDKITDFYKKVVSEIPAFIHYLLNDHVMTEPESQSRAWFSNDIVTQYFREILYEQTKNPDITLLKHRATTWLAFNPKENELRFLAEEVRRFYSIKMPISEFVTILTNEPWINRYPQKTRRQYHVSVFDGTYIMKAQSQLTEDEKFLAVWSKRDDRREGLFYINREDLINPEDDKQPHDNNGDDDSEPPF